LQNTSQSFLGDDQIDPRELLRAIWCSKRLIIGSSALFAVVFLIVIMAMPDKYISSTVLAPTDSSVAGVPRTLGSFGGLASLAGLNVANIQDEAQIAEQIIESWGFLESFIEQNNLQVEIYAASGWDKESNSLIIDDDIYDVEEKKWLILGDDGQLRAPTSWELYKRFSEMMTLSPDSQTGFIVLSVEYYSPYIAKQWVDLVFQDINSYMQQRKLSKVNSSIEFLQAQIEKTSIADMEQVFYALIEEQIKSKMLAEATPEHTFVVVSQSMVPEERSGPKKVLLFTVGTLFFLFIAISIVLIKYLLFGSSKLLLK
jgi:LPS O-antigen subunit length determinant protein (WzzB/FepE family)